MNNARLLILAMSETCRSTILKWQQAPYYRDAHLPKPLLPPHLLKMCDRIERHADDWTAEKLNRWIGFIQCALLANRIIDLDQAKEMFNSAKVAHAETEEDMLDHLDPTSSFELDIGGEG